VEYLKEKFNTTEQLNEVCHESAILMKNIVYIFF